MIWDRLIGPQRVDDDFSGRDYYLDVMERVFEPLTALDLKGFRHCLSNASFNHSDYPSAGWVGDFWVVYPYVQGQDFSKPSNSFIRRKTEAWGTTPAEHRYHAFRRGMALRLSTKYRKNELDYTLAYWHHYPLETEDAEDVKRIYYHFYDSAMQDPRRGDETSEWNRFRGCMALFYDFTMTGWLNCLRDYWRFHPPSPTTDPPQVFHILTNEPTFQSPTAFTETEYASFRLRLHSQEEGCFGDSFIKAYWKFHPPTPEESQKGTGKRAASEESLEDFFKRVRTTGPLLLQNP